MSPKNHKNKKAVAGKEAAIPLGKALAKKGAKVPFTKPRKGSPPKTELEGCTQEEWETDCVRRNFATAERQDQHVAAATKEKAANAMHIAALAAAATSSPWSGSVSGPAYIPGVASPSTLGFFNDLGSSTRRFSLHYVDDAATRRVQLERRRPFAKQILCCKNLFGSEV
jgi:hypothetical protein